MNAGLTLAVKKSCLHYLKASLEDFMKRHKAPYFNGDPLVAMFPQTQKVERGLDSEISRFEFRQVIITVLRAERRSHYLDLISDTYCVYFDGQLQYELKSPNGKFHQDIRMRMLGGPEKAIDYDETVIEI